MNSIPPYEESLNASKINRIVAQCPDGVPMTSVWLASQKVSAQLANCYKHSGWLASLGRGAWMRVGTKLTLAGAIYAVQQQLQIKVYLAARTALELQGRTHFAPLGSSPVLQLSVEAGQNLPAWFTAQSFASNINVLNSSALFDPVFVGLTEWKSGELPIKISSPERAIVEYCYFLPKNADFDEAWQLMEGLTSLRPRLLQNILLACKSIKTKRLFLALSCAVGHSWYKQLDIESFELGAGNRSVMANGHLHPQFKITVPREWIIS